MPRTADNEQQKEILEQEKQPQQEQPTQGAQLSILLGSGIRERKNTDSGGETAEVEETVKQVICAHGVGSGRLLGIR